MNDRVVLGARKQPCCLRCFSRYLGLLRLLFVQDITSWQPKAKEQLLQVMHFQPEACKLLSFEVVVIGGKTRGEAILSAEKNYVEIENEADNLAKANTRLVITMHGPLLPSRRVLFS